MMSLICMDVRAETAYTDYEFIGYTQEQKENDEFYKYEQTKLNRFYKLVETNVQYVRETDPYNQKYIDMSDCKLGDLLSTNKNLPYDNKTRTVTFKVNKDYLIHKIEIKNISNLSNIKKIDIYSNKISIKSFEPKEDNLSTITLEFQEVTLENIEVIFYYSSTTNINLNISIIDNEDNKILNKDLTLESRNDKFSLNALCNDNYEKFLTINSLWGQEESYYYRYKVKKYRVYDLKKEYYIDSENTYFDGYTYDEEESYKAYKIYKREELSVKDDPIIEETAPTPSTDTEVNRPTQDDETDKTTERPSEIPITNKVGIITTTKKLIKTTTKVQNVSKSDNENDNENENNFIGEPYETVDNMSKTNLTDYKSKNDLSTCECKLKINIFTIIGLIMIIASLIITGIHYYSVNHS